MTKKGIFCLEGLWENDLRKNSSVEPILSLLELKEDIPYIYRDCATAEEFEFYLNKWVQKTYKGYPILYLAFHGDKGKILISGKGYELKDIANTLTGKCDGTVIVLGSCKSLELDKRKLKSFLKKTGAFAVCGYKADVDWIGSTAFELLLLYELQVNKFDGRGIVSVETKMKKLSDSFKDLNFRFVSLKK